MPMIRLAVTFAAVALALTAGAMIMDRNSAGDWTPARTATAEKAQNSRTAAARVTAISADRNGQFSAAALVNGVHVDMLADTGASLVVLSEADAQRIGIDLSRLSYDVSVRTANGTSSAAHTVLDEVQVGGISLRNVDALVAPPGALVTSLLGMSFIGSLTRFELRGDQLVLVQ
jgi:aspartyl protease family protein